MVPVETLHATSDVIFLTTMNILLKCEPQSADMLLENKWFTGTVRELISKKEVSRDRTEGRKTS